MIQDQFIGLMSPHNIVILSCVGQSVSNTANKVLLIRPLIAAIGVLVEEKRKEGRRSKDKTPSGHSSLICKIPSIPLRSKSQRSFLCRLCRDADTRVVAPQSRIGVSAFR